MRIWLVFILFGFLACKTNQNIPADSGKSNKDIFVPQYIPGPKALVYKTKADYRKLVPVLLSEDKKDILSYPDPGDIIKDGRYTLPTELHKGYLLDNRGIGVNAGFLKLTYEEYAELKSVPSLEMLNKMLIDRDPITEISDCGNRNAFINIEAQLNKAIDENKLRNTCKVIK